MLTWKLCDFSGSGPVLLKNPYFLFFYGAGGGGGGVEVRDLLSSSGSAHEYIELQWLKLKWLIHLGWLELSSQFIQVILCITHPGWLELPLARTIFHGPKPVHCTAI